MREHHQLRNLCIVAHVDHGKTTLVDHLLRQTQATSQKETGNLILDRETLEKERGITILAKNAAVLYGETKINIVDTPGHADFGGEVERIMGMVDGSILLVDAFEGPLPQTRFVLQKALKQNHRFILCVNKVDRPQVRGDGEGRIHEVVDKIFDLFLELGASDEQCHFPVFYTCARQGWCTESFEEMRSLLEHPEKGSLDPLFQCVLKHFHPPAVRAGDHFILQVADLAWSDYLGRLAIGRIIQGKLLKNQELHHLSPFGSGSGRHVPARLFEFKGVERVETQTITAGDIVAIAGMGDVKIGDTLSSEMMTPLPAIKIDPPTVKMIFSVNTSPMSGQEGKAIQNRHLSERLEQECRRNVALQFVNDPHADHLAILGRGELQFSVLIETMRREGLEFMIGRPEIVLQKDENGQVLEPIEHVVCDIPEASVGDVTELLQTRKGTLSNFTQQGHNRVRLEFTIPSRGLLGVRNRFLTITKGEGAMSSEIKAYEPFKGHFLHRKNGCLVADRQGPTTDYALESLEERGVLFIGPQVNVYEGMIIGECHQENDINVNPTKVKKLTNVRSTSSEGLTMLSGIRRMSLEECMEWIDEDEWIECTPESVRLRKKILPGNQRSVIRRTK